MFLTKSKGKIKIHTTDERSRKVAAIAAAVIHANDEKAFIKPPKKSKKSWGIAW